MDLNSIDNRFYTPDISEFHIEFCYQELCQKEWNKLIKPPKDLGEEWKNFEFGTYTSLSKITNLIKQGRIRVKYLDSEDMLSLGFTQDENHKCPFTGKSGNKFYRTGESVGFNNGMYFTIILSGRGMIQLEYQYYSSYSNPSGKLQMLVKNKLELSKLLNQFSN